MTNYAHIEVTQREIHPTGRVYRTYKWIGSKNLPIKFYEEPPLDLPFKLVKIQDDFLEMTTTYMREDAKIAYWIIKTKSIAYNFYWAFLIDLWRP